MRRPDIEITIDELVVTGLNGRDVEVVAESLRRELGELATTWDCLPAAAAPGTPALEVQVVPGMTAAALGSQAAHALHRHLVPGS